MRADEAKRLREEEGKAEVMLQRKMAAAESALEAEKVGVSRALSLSPPSIPPFALTESQSLFQCHNTHPYKMTLPWNRVGERQRKGKLEKRTRFGQLCIDA